MNVFLIMAFSAESQDVYNTIVLAAKETDSIILRADNIRSNTDALVDINAGLEKSDLIMADISNGNPNVMFELGLALPMKKPVILICRRGVPIPFDIKTYRVIFYDRSRLDDTLLLLVKNVFSHKDVKELVTQEILAHQKEKAKLKTVFVSYSHADTQYLARLEVHLKPFERAGKMELWSDTRIKAGEKWKERIKETLNKSVIAILLVSADFLASDFIIDDELPPLLKSAEEKGTLILPIILKPCRFSKSSQLSKFQAINDPQMPLSKMDDNGREETYVRVADYIDDLL